MDKIQIKDPRQQFVQLFLTEHLQLGDVLQQLLQFLGPSVLTVSTFSVGEEFLTRLHKLKKNNLVRHATLFCDHKAAEKTARIMPMIKSVYDEVLFVPNHSKVMIVEGAEDTALVMTSQNQTRGNRLENYAIFSLPGEAEKVKKLLLNLKTYQV